MSRKRLPIEPYIEKLEQALLLGATYELAARYAGISVSTFDRWRRQAEHARAGTPLAHLRDRLHQAEARAAIGWLAKIEQAANNGDWRAAAFKLERRYPYQWGRHVQADLTMRIRQMAEEVAAEMGVEVDALMAEAHLFLREHS
jgi:hypothetical protein